VGHLQRRGIRSGKMVMVVMMMLGQVVVVHLVLGHIVNVAH
jgi:hypothetical protein